MSHGSNANTGCRSRGSQIRAHGIKEQELENYAAWMQR